MSQPITVAVCIPTYKRPNLLAQALESCLAQTQLPHEILIGDNSPDTATEELVAAIVQTTSVPIRYIHHVPGLTQTLNVDVLFKAVQSELLVLLHDDDTLVADCIESLAACFLMHPDTDAAFGKQYIMSHNSQVDYEASASLNQDYYRTADYAGTKLSTLEGAMLQQFPNNSWMIRSAVAKALGYTSKYKHACDVDFGLQLALAKYQTYFLDKYTAYYRLSDDALSSNLDNDGALTLYQLVEQTDVPPESLHYQARALKINAPRAISQAANLKRPQEALRIYFSKWNKGNLLTTTGLKGAYHVLRSFL